MSDTIIQNQASYTDEFREALKERQARYDDTSEALQDLTLALSKITDEHGMANTMRALAHITRYYGKTIKPASEAHAAAAVIMSTAMLTLMDLSEVLTPFIGTLGLRKREASDG